MVEDLYDLIGGRSTVEAATELFYDKVLKDDHLRQFFEGVDMAHLRSPGYVRLHAPRRRSLYRKESS